MREVLAWAELTRRDFGWRRTRDPWAVLVSEVMLQQTQTARVEPAWAAFLARFPDPPSCAAAPVGAVVAAWAGLGYNRRAVRLHRCAVHLVRDHRGRVPADLEALRNLPGVGPYTARAVLAFAFESDVGVVDTNAARVLARAVGRRLGAAEAQRVADGLVPAGRGWAWNQAVLDLGATVCTARRPICHRCPLAGGRCEWERAGRRPPDPAGGSTGSSAKQSPFSGSNRQGRGRLVAALREGPVAPSEVPRVAGWPDDAPRAAAAAASLVADGLAVVGSDGALRLP